MSSDLLIYALVDPRTLFVRYVGASRSGMARPKQHRWPSSMARATHSACWVRSLHSHGLTFDIVVLEDGFRNEATLYEAERWWIAYGKALGWDLTNLTAGGEGQIGWVPKAETRAKISASLRGRKLPDEVKEKMSVAHRGHVFSAEHCKNLSEAASRRWARIRELPKD